MSTNYYLRAPKTKLHAIMRVEAPQIHLGSLSFGWAFIFQGDREAGIININTWQLMVDDAMTEGAEIFDEYGTKIDFLELIEKIKNAANGKKHCVEYPDENSWVDADGNSFIGGEFS